MNIYVTVQNSYKLGLKVTGEIHRSCSKITYIINWTFFNYKNSFCPSTHNNILSSFCSTIAPRYFRLVLTVVVLSGVAVPWTGWEVDRSALCRVHRDSAVFLGLGDVTKWTRRMMLVAASCRQEGIRGLGYTCFVLNSRPSINFES